MDYLPIIGLEIHVEPATKSKMFCACPADHFGQPANTHTCPVCLGLPGALPVPNKAAIEACLKLGLALNCQINLSSKFDRKNYFYPDLPKGYQISQYDMPFCYKGSFQMSSSRTRGSMPGLATEDLVNNPTMDSRPLRHSFSEASLRGNDKGETLKLGITRVHMEEDTGKLQHAKLDVQEVSLVDYNRSGVPLVEIVTEPDLHSASQTKDFLKNLVHLIRWYGISDCDMEKGTLRLEANISVQKPGETELPGYKVEIKNVNSFRFIEKAIAYEIDRQIEILKSGQTPAQETRGFNEDKGLTFSQRSKETAQDYRYFPEPDIPPISLTQANVDSLKSSLSESPAAAKQRLVDDHQLREDYASQLLENRSSFEKFESLLSQLPSEIKPSDAAKQIVNQKLNLEILSIEEIITKIKSSQRSYSMSESELSQIVDQVILNNPNPVAEYKSGKLSVLAFLIGQVAKQTKGQADPQLIKELLEKKLSHV